MSVGRRRKAGTSPYAAALGFSNVGAAQVRALAKAIVRDHPEWTVDDAVRFADVLIRNRALLDATRQILRRRITQPLRHPSAKIPVTARGIPDVRD